MRAFVGTVMMVAVVAAGLVASPRARAATVTAMAYGYDTGTSPNASYPDTFGAELTNGVIGSTSYLDAAWVGFRDPGMTFPAKVTFRFQAPVAFSGISIAGLNEPGNGIQPLSTFTVSYSSDGTTFGGDQTFNTTPAEQSGNPAVTNFVRTLSGTGVYVRVSMDTGGSGTRYLFISEVTLQGTVASSNISPLCYVLAPGTAGSGYPDTGSRELIDGVIGSVSFADPAWAGWREGVAPFPVTNTFDFGFVHTFATICIAGLNNVTNGIGQLGTFTVSYSTNGTTFSAPQTFTTSADERLGDPAVAIFTRPIPGSGRYLRLTMDKASSTFLFVSEVMFSGVPRPTTVPASYAYDAGTSPNASYPDTGGAELTDGVIGPVTFGNAAWVGFRWAPLTAPAMVTFDFGEEKFFTDLCVVGLNEPGNGIQAMTNLTVSFSRDGLAFGSAQAFTPTAAEKAGNPEVHTYAVGGWGFARGRYVKLSLDIGVVDPRFLFISEAKFLTGIPPRGTVVCFH